MNSSGKSLKKAFESCFFDPRKLSSLSTIVSTASADYLLDRGMEMLRDAKQHHGIERWAKVRDAVAVLAYSMTLTE